MSRCSYLGHNLEIKEEDSSKILEVCSDCGYKTVHHKEAIEDKRSNESQKYAKEHERDFIQPGDKDRWKEAWDKEETKRCEDLRISKENSDDAEFEEDQRRNYDRAEHRKYFG